MGSKNNDAKFAMEAMAEEVKLNLALACQKMTKDMSHKSQDEPLVPSRSHDYSMQSTSDASGIIDSLYQERPGLHFLSDYDQKLSHKERKAQENITEQDLNEMKAMISEVRSNPSLIYQKFDLPWNEKKHGGMDSIAPNVRSNENRQKCDQPEAIDLSNDYDHHSPGCVIKATQSRRFSSDQFPTPPLTNPLPPKKNQGSQPQL
jgi:hypothetical protein